MRCKACVTPRFFHSKKVRHVYKAVGEPFPSIINMKSFDIFMREREGDGQFYTGQFFAYLRCGGCEFQRVAETVKLASSCGVEPDSVVFLALLKSKHRFIHHGS